MFHLFHISRFNCLSLPLLRKRAFSSESNWFSINQLSRMSIWFMSRKSLPTYTHSHGAVPPENFKNDQPLSSLLRFSNRSKTASTPATSCPRSGYTSTGRWPSSNRSRTSPASTPAWCKRSPRSTGSRPSWKSSVSTEPTQPPIMVLRIFFFNFMRNVISRDLIKPIFLPKWQISLPKVVLLICISFFFSPTPLFRSHTHPL